MLLHASRYCLCLYWNISTVPTHGSGCSFNGIVINGSLSTCEPYEHFNAIAAWVYDYPSGARIRGLLCIWILRAHTIPFCVSTSSLQFSNGHLLCFSENVKCYVNASLLSTLLRVHALVFPRLYIYVLQVDLIVNMHM